MDPMTKAFVADIHGFVAARGLELVHFAKGQREDDLAGQFLGRFSECEGVLFVGRAQEKAGVWRTQRATTLRPGAATRGWCAPRRSSTQLFLLRGRRFRSVLPQDRHLLPLYRQVVYQHQRVGQAPGREGRIGFTALDNRFAAVDNVERLQQICDSFGSEHIEALLGTWLRILPNPFTDADETAGCRYELSVLQAEFSLTQMLDRRWSGRIFFEQVLHDNLDIGRPEQTGRVFDAHHPPDRCRQPCWWPVCSWFSSF
jgi:hypothetical protein